MSTVTLPEAAGAKEYQTSFAVLVLGGNASTMFAGVASAHFSEPQAVTPETNGVATPDESVRSRRAPWPVPPVAELGVEGAPV